MNNYSQFIKAEDSALLLVDIQKVMLDLCVNPDKVVKHSSALIGIAKILDLPVVFSVHNSEKLGGCLDELLEMVPEPKVLNKLTFSCFENEGLVRAVQSTGRRTLLLAGIETHVCVFHSSVHALRLGYNVHVAVDAVTSRSILNWEIGLRRMEKAGVVISSTEMMIFELLNRAGTPEFRDALPLLKILS